MTLFYPDVSNNNWGSTELTDAGRRALLDFLSRLRDEGFAGVSHKMTQDAGFIDPYGAICQDWCDQNNFPFIGYHYVGTDDAGAQAQNWRAAGGRNNVMFDWEQGSGDLNEFWACVNSFNDIGVNVQLAYDPRWYLEGAGSGAGTDISNFAANGILLVSSAYPLGYQSGYASALYDQCGGDGGGGWIAYDGGPIPSAWQFTSSAIIGGVSGVDCNAYRGTDLNVLFGATAAPAPAAPDQPPPVVIPPTTPGPPVDYSALSLVGDPIFTLAPALSAQFGA